MTELLKAFLVGGLLCVIGQLLIDKTKLMSGRVLKALAAQGQPFRLRALAFALRRGS